ncbi:MAG TPA: NYN domain-containing protein [Solirubrobacteraceae bacterium]|jgi:predicted RNA-binding protein with PIN domain|nr:NYN domain-containing protein [Solirubrobacteraceae bacterium]
MRWVVDGMNVIGSRPDGWWRDRRRAMVDLVGRLEAWAEATGEQVTVVFEGRSAGRIESERVGVVHAPRTGRNAADDEIVRRLAADSQPESVRVVTSDRVLAERVRALGGEVEPASRFRAVIDPVG